MSTAMDFNLKEFSCEQSRDTELQWVVVSGAQLRVITIGSSSIGCDTSLSMLRPVVPKSMRGRVFNVFIVIHTLELVPPFEQFRGDSYGLGCVLKFGSDYAGVCSSSVQNLESSLKPTPNRFQCRTKNFNMSILRLSDRSRRRVVFDITSLCLNSSRDGLRSVRRRSNQWLRHPT